VRDQYAGYTVVDDIHINSKLTLGEDVADLGGTLLAYLAWKHATAQENYNPSMASRQISVSSWAWRNGPVAMNAPKKKRMGATVDPHSPDEFRINGVVANMPEFGQAFSCKPGDPMMRVNACRVW